MAGERRSFYLDEDQTLAAAGVLEDHKEIQEFAQIVINRRTIESVTGEDPAGKYAAMIIEVAERVGRVKGGLDKIRTCFFCKKYLVTRPKYKSGPRKGQSNYDKPEVSAYGIDFGLGYGFGACSECWDDKANNFVVLAALVDAKAEIIYAGKHLTPWRYDEEVQCPLCSATFYRSEIKPYYNWPDCPRCKQNARWHGLKSTKQWRLIDAENKVD